MLGDENPRLCRGRIRRGKSRRAEPASPLQRFVIRPKTGQGISGGCLRRAGARQQQTGLRIHPVAPKGVNPRGLEGWVWGLCGFCFLSTMPFGAWKGCPRPLDPGQLCSTAVRVGQGSCRQR